MPLSTQKSKKACNIRDVAEYAGVSAGTVSRILNSRAGVRISEPTRKKVLHAITELNYTPNINAQRLFTKRTHVIGLVVPSYNKMGKHIFEDHHLTRMISGLEKGLSAADYSILLIFSDEKFEREKRFLDFFRSCSIDGMIIWGAYEREDFWSELVAEKYPYLFITNVPELKEPVNYLINDCEQAGFLMADHLLSRGHRRLAWLEGKSGISLTRAQSHGISRALQQYHMSLDDIDVISGDFTVEYGYAAAEKLLSRKHNRATAVITASTDTAVGVMNYARAEGISIPEELAIGSCDSSWDYYGELDELTRVRVNDLALGECAAQSILKLIDHADTLIQHRYGIELLTGKTS